MRVTSEIICPFCDCGETVTLTDEGFQATTVQVGGCSKLRADGFESATWAKSYGLGFRSASASDAPVRHRSGLVRFGGLTW